MKLALKWLLGVVLFCMLALGVWLQDEALDADAQLWISQAQGRGPSQAYFQLLGMAAPAGVDPQSYGRARLEQHWQWRATHPLSMPLPEPAAQLALPGNEVCLLGQPACVGYVQAHPEQVNQWLDTHHELIDRYLNLLALADYRSLSQPSTDAPMPAYLALERANRLYALHIAQLAQQGQAELALSLLEHNIVQLRRWLAQADTLVLKMLLMQLLSHDLDALARLYQHDWLDAPAPQPPLTATERSFNAPLAHEFASIASGLSGLQDDAAAQGLSHWQLRWLFKPAMSINDLAAQFQRVQHQATLDAEAFALSRAAVADVQSSRIRQWRNPIGHILGAVAQPDLTQYIARRHDLERKLALFNQLGEGAPEHAKWDHIGQRYCAYGPDADPRGLRCLPWNAPPARLDK